MKVSVVMASFNGEKYIQRQLDSILCQLKSEDELLISDDGSKDKTMQIVKQYQERYSVIRTVEGPRRGVVNNFNNAIRQAKNDVIFLCDQDDVWMPDKIEIVKKCFEHNKNRKVIMHDAVLCDENEKIFSKESIFEKRNAKNGILRNLLYSTYYGCCMAAKKDYLMQLTPLPDYAPYDQYIGICAEADNVSYFIPKALIKHRITGENMSKRMSIIPRIQIRANLLKGLISYKKELKK